MSPKQKFEGYTYDKASRRYRDPSGTITSISDIKSTLKLRANQPEDGTEFGFTVPSFNRAPDSQAYAQLERIVGMGERGVDITHDRELLRAADKFNHLLAFFDSDDMTDALPYPHKVYNPDIEGTDKDKWVLSADDRLVQQQPPQPIPTGIRSAMTLAEYYWNTQGDVAQFIEAPIDISISKLKISVPKDKKVEKMLKDLYSPENLNMKNVLGQLMLNMGIFGSGYPMEVPDDSYQPHEIRQIIPLPPKFMWVGYHMVNGTLVPDGYPSPYAIRPWNGAPNWTQKLADATFMPMTYNSLGSGFNEQIIQGWGLPVNPIYLHPVRSKALHWTRYPLPPMSRAFRSISTRAIYQEMRRALLEGFKNQLWLFILGTDKGPPSPQEMLALKSAVDGLAGQRTGNLVWRYGLDVSVKAPQAFNDAIGNEVAQSFTIEVARDLGANIRFVTGMKVNMPGSGGGDSGVDLDMSIWLRRMEYLREGLMEWEYLFRMRQADRWDGRKSLDDPPGPARRALENAKVQFSRSILDISNEIKQVIIPLYTIGLSSPQTSLEKADQDYDTELANKKDFEPNKELFMPPPTYNQLATPASGETKQSTTSQPKGRPADAVNPNKLKAAFNDTATRKLYYTAVLAILDELGDDGDVDAFVASLKSANEQWTRQIGTEAYAEAGGVGSPDLELLSAAANYVNAYADNFGSDLKKILADGDAVNTNNNKRRTLMYATEGSKAAAVNGTNRAMDERGANGYRRVLHPELSKSGPCPMCVADSHVTHSIDEPFQIMHPNDLCGSQVLGLQYFSGHGIPSMEVPLPNSGNDLSPEFGSDKKSGRTRRKRIT